VGTNDGNEGAVTITGCKVSNSRISVSDPLSNVGVAAGGLVGQTIRRGTITDCIASNGKVTATSMNGDAYSGSFAGVVGSSNGSISGNTTTITELPAIGEDNRLDPPAPSDDI
jgi:hypothetical protein